MHTKKVLPLPLAFICNIALAYIILMLCRVIFLAVNYELYADSLASNSFEDLLRGSLLFDTAAVCYLNIPYILALLLPLHFKEGRFAQWLTHILYTVGVAVGVVANLADSVYVPFTGRRSTWSVFSEFSNEGNIAKIIGGELIAHWYLTIGAILIIWMAYKLYRPAKAYENGRLMNYYVTRTVTLLVVAPLLICGIRGGMGKHVRPITISNANQYVNAPGEAAIVLNTPFSMIRTINKNPFKEVKYYSQPQLEAIYSPVHIPASDSTFIEKNVVVFILESFGKDYIGAYNPHRDTPSLTPFLDSLIAESRTYAYSYGNGRKSIDGMPSVLSSIPMFVEPFFVTPASLNRVSGLAGELAKKGYNTAFFHGAPNGSMGFQAFARTTGYRQYYGLDEFNAAKKDDGNDHFDGTWAIWDEPFFEYYAQTMDTIKEPFVTTMFSASSHHPFRIPEKYHSVIPEGELPIHKCITYTDKALRTFFEKAKKSEWFKNTLFVITADHINQTNNEHYKTAAGGFEVPIIFYSPDKAAPFAPGVDSCKIAQQIDIMPTVLQALNYDRQFIAFGQNLIATPAENSFAVNYNNNIYQYFKGEHMLQFDGSNSVALYNVRKDKLLKENLVEELPTVVQTMEKELKAIIQDYMQRMLGNDLVIE
ncbi:MAG: sulfatase-like hydrolase/transferase [Bacteroidaceae bacterium]|nr:sulfatase-like hydrolase/transferase [Bacteroidaceae bacterium]